MRRKQVGETKGESNQQAYASYSPHTHTKTRHCCHRPPARLPQVLPELTPQGLSNLGWALAMTCAFPAPLLHAWRARVVALLPYFGQVGQRCAALGCCCGGGCGRAACCRRAAEEASGRTGGHGVCCHSAFTHEDASWGGT